MKYVRIHQSLRCIATTMMVGLVYLMPVLDASAYTAIGNGVSSCGTWTADRHTRSAQRDAEEQWVLGFLGGIGYVAQHGDDPLNNMDADGVWAWMDNYCKSHPISKIAEAAAAFYVAHPH